MNLKFFLNSTDLSCSSFIYIYVHASGKESLIRILAGKELSDLDDVDNRLEIVTDDIRVPSLRIENASGD